MPLERYIENHRARVEKALTNIFPNNNPINENLVKAMKYCVFNGGKRIRPTLTYAASECVGGLLTNADAAACAVELIHTYSLVHDDLPALDDDNLRRGKPTCHKAYDEATAILVGDALQTFAFEALSTPHFFPDNTLSDSQRLKQIHAISVASGYAEMVGGQAMDLASIGLPLNKSQLIQMHQHKTGALIKACIKVGALTSASIEDWQLQCLDHYGSAIGLAFQVQDDILDVVTDTETLGKQQGADQALNKPTYVSVMGLKDAQQFVIELLDSAIEALTDFGDKSTPLQQLACYIVKRQY